MNSEGAMLRWLSTARGFTPDENSSIIGPIGGKMLEDGSFAEDITWGPGRWSAGTTLILLQLSRDALEESGFTYAWTDAHLEESGYTYNGLNLLTTPPANTAEECRAALEAGEQPCSAEWAVIAMEKSMRTTDELTVTMVIAEGINVEMNRE